jgi:hypothetical protein
MDLNLTEILALMGFTSGMIALILSFIASKTATAALSRTGGGTTPFNAEQFCQSVKADYANNPNAPQRWGFPTYCEWLNAPQNAPITQYCSQGDC